jgi:hypothetical protein
MRVRLLLFTLGVLATAPDAMGQPGALEDRLYLGGSVSFAIEPTRDLSRFGPQSIGGTTIAISARAGLLSGVASP